MKKIIFLLLPFLFLSSCSAIKTISLLKGGKLKEKNYLAIIPFEVEHGEIVLLVRINGKTYRFFFDTGAINIINKDLADNLHVKSKTEIKANDSEGNIAPIELTKIDKITIGNLDFINQGTAIFNFDEHPELACLEIDGIIGANLMRKSIWQIDMVNKTMSITNNIDSLIINEPDIMLPFSPEMTGTPCFNIMIDSITFKNIKFDYGSNSGFSLISDNLTEDTTNIKSKFIESYGAGSAGLYGISYDTILTFKPASLSIGNSTINDKITTIKEKGLSTLGTEILSEYIVTIDWFENLIYMKKHDSAFVKAENGIKTFGFTASLLDNELTINQVFKNSPAYNKGIIPGDKIITINGKDFSQITQQEYCDIILNELLPEDITEIELVYKRNDEITKVFLQKTILPFE